MPHVRTRARIAAMIASPVMIASAGLLGAAANVDAAPITTAAIVTCSDTNAQGQVDGAEDYVLTALDPQVDEHVPTGAVQAACMNSALSDSSVQLTAKSADGSQKTVTLAPARQVTIQLYEKDTFNFDLLATVSN